MDYWFRLPIRTKIGIISTVLLVIAGIAIFLACRDPSHRFTMGAIIKLAPILFLLWLAWTDLQNIPLWVYLVLPPIIIFCSLKPAALFFVIPLGLVALFVMPKKKKK